MKWWPHGEGDIDVMMAEKINLLTNSLFILVLIWMRRMIIVQTIIKEYNLSLSLSVAQEMLSASISQTRILQTCGVPHPNMVGSGNPLQGNDQIHKRTHLHKHNQSQTCS